jgi:hypothetical protein
VESNRRRTFWARIDDPGSETPREGHLFGTTLTVTRQIVDKWSGTITGPGISGA